MKKRTIFTILGIVCALAAAVSIAMVVKTTYTPKNVLSETFAPSAAPTSTPTPAAETISRELPTPSPTPSPAPTEEPSVPEYVSPVDFEELQKINPDIYAWIEIDGTDINHPVLQNETDDTYYLTHNSDGNYSAGGAIFTEATYTAKDFSDPVTVLYGHHTMTGAIFSHLQEYFSDPEFMAENPVINIYTPTEQLTYRVFAAIPYTDAHILYDSDFTDEETFEVFMNTVYSVRDLGAQLDEEHRPEPGDRLLILSTCYQGTSGRFLVLSSLEEPETAE